MGTSPRSIAGRTVAITGAARGIGRATAEALVRGGARVAIGDIDGDLARATATELGGSAVAFDLDVTDPASVERFVDDAEEAVGPLDVFVNNAGIMPTVRFLDEPAESIRRQFDINVHGVIHGTRAVLPRMIARGDGHVINVASTAGKFAPPGIVTYTATKHAVVGLTDALRAELRDSPIALSVVMPVIVRTELTAGIPDTRGVKALKPEDVADGIVDAVRTRRYEVWCPRQMNVLHRATKLLPLRASDAMTRILKADQALLAGIDAPERQAYLARINETPVLSAGETQEDSR